MSLQFKKNIVLPKGVWMALCIFTAFLLSACTDYLDEFKDDYNTESFIAWAQGCDLDERGEMVCPPDSSENDDESSSSVSSPESVSSSSVMPSSSALVSSSSNNKEVSSSSAKSSSSVDDGRITPIRIGPVSQYGKLITGKDSSGNGYIYGSCEGVKDGAEVQVRGMSLFWSLLPESMEFWTEQGIATMVDDMNIQLVRAAMAVENEYEPGEWNDIQLNGYLRDPDNQKQFVKTVVEAAIKYDIYVIIDWHLVSNDGYTSEAVQFFEYMAQEYGRYDNVIFEIWNEPKNIESVSILKSHADDVIAAIRKHSDNLVLVGNSGWPSHPEDCISIGINDQNYACTLHFYAGSHRVGDGHAARANQAISMGVPVFVSEWGSANSDGDGNPNESSSDDWIAWMNKYKISWANWSASKVKETSAAFNESATNTSLQYTSSGNYVKNYLASSPKSYTACKAAGSN